MSPLAQIPAISVSFASHSTPLGLDSTPSTSSVVGPPDEIRVPSNGLSTPTKVSPIPQPRAKKRPASQRLEELDQDTIVVHHPPKRQHIDLAATGSPREPKIPGVAPGTVGSSESGIQASLRPSISALHPNGGHSSTQDGRDQTYIPQTSARRAFHMCESAHCKLCGPLKGVVYDDSSDEDDSLKKLQPPSRRADQKHSKKMNMVCSSHLHLVANSVDGPRIECDLDSTSAFLPHESLVYQYGGFVADVWFFNMESGAEVWKLETCMVCDTKICAACNDSASGVLSDATMAQSPTQGLPFVHGMDCDKDHELLLVWDPLDDDRDVEAVASLGNHSGWLRPGDVEKTMPTRMEKRVVNFSVWGRQEAMVCMSGHCMACGVWESAGRTTRKD